MPSDPPQHGKGSLRHVAETGCGVFGGLAGCAVAPFAIGCGALLVLLLLSAIFATRGTQRARRLPSAAQPEAVPQTDRSLHASRRPQQTKPDARAGIGDSEDLYRVVLGKSVGPVRIGMKEDEAVALANRSWGSGALDLDTVVQRNWHWLGRHVWLHCFATSEGWTVESVVVSDGRFRTGDGFCVGMPYPRAKELLGEPVDVLWLSEKSGVLSEAHQATGQGVVQWPGLEVDVVNSKVADFRIYAER